jgi:dipeptidyl aminopeptidase/acylaminoacyl peptidase
MPIRKFLIAVALVACALALAAQSKPKLTLDDFFNSVTFPNLELSPDGNSVVIETERADWDEQIFRTDLWLYREDNKTLIPLTQSGHDSGPKWSPDGQWIAFLSERKNPSGKDDDSDASSDSKDDAAQIYLISPNGGEAFPITRGEEEVHAFAWSADSRKIYFATRQPWTKSQKDDYKEKWKDVIQYRTAERGDTIFRMDLVDALAAQQAAPAKIEKKEGKPEPNPDRTPNAQEITSVSLRVDSIVAAPVGERIAFVTNAINERQEKYEDVEIYTLDLPEPSKTHADESGSDSSRPRPVRVTHNQGVETGIRWAKDGRHILFSVEVGDVSGPYRDLQPHLYWAADDHNPVGAGSPDAVEQWAKDFIGPVEHYAVTTDSILASARTGTEVQIYSAAKPSESFHRLSAWPGTYSLISTAARSPKVAFVYSALGKPEEIYLADSPTALDRARPITSLNHLFTERDLPQGKPYRWQADDGTTVEGMLIYPPGKFEQKHLPMFTLIHGGPADADGNSFGADWYDWAALAASKGWLVFRPNYRGSTGYGDKFLLEIVPHIVSRPGKDILEGVDALVHDGIADPDRLTIGGYSYGGYMTNWLITQTTRFKAAVTGAGAVEHIGNWGNDDTTYDDAYFLGGRPWEAPERYHDEAAIFQINKVTTPTHMVAGADDIRVAVLEDYLLEHALYSLGIPNRLLIFPGEGHGLGKNPWHGKIKVREELEWLDQYGSRQ